MIIMKLNVGLLNDSFWPVIDGVTNVVDNYARIIKKNFGNSVVVTPKSPNFKDDYEYEVFRYDSIPLDKKYGYRAGNPFNSKTVDELCGKNFDILHVHSPFASGLLARFILQKRKIPLITTYHTKYDTDIENIFALKLGQKLAIDFLINNISFSDEVWAVSNGAADNLRSLGYQGKVTVVKNGTDFKKGKSSQEEILLLKKSLSIPNDMPLLIYVGRMMWYKNIKIILDALKIVDDRGTDFVMLFVGRGSDELEIKKYAEKLKISSRIAFHEPVRSRDILKVYYSASDIMVFPSTFDTNGLVVGEAAACATPSILTKGSCAAEGIEDSYNGFLVEENSESCAESIIKSIMDINKTKLVGNNAKDTIYLSWDEAVSVAYNRYESLVKDWPYPLPNQSG